MQEKLTVSIDAREQVHYAGVLVGVGEDDFNAALDRIPVEHVETLMVRDERSKGTATVESHGANGPIAHEWTLPLTTLSTAPKEAIQSAPDQEYVATGQVALNNRSEERVLLDPEVQDTVRPKMSYIPSNWEAQKAEEAAAARQASDELFQKRQEKPEVRKVVRSLAEREEERKRLEEEEAQKQREEQMTDEEREVITQEAEQREREANLLPHHEEGESLDWTKIEIPVERHLSIFGEEEEELSLGESPHQEVEVTLPAGTHENSAYLPGERLETETIASKKARMKVNKEFNRKPLAFIGVVALLVLVGWGIRLIANPATHYEAVCVDSRTQLVTEEQRCLDGEASTQSAYVLEDQVAGLSPLDHLPDGSELTVPSGNVKVLELGEE